MSAPGGGMRLVLWGLLVFIMANALGPRAVQGCSCAPSHPQQAFCAAHLVTRARVVGEAVVAGPEGSASTQYEISLLQVFKGPGVPGDATHLYTNREGYLCGAKLKTDTEYLLAARRVEDRLRISLCDLAKPWASVSAAQAENLAGEYGRGCGVCSIKLCYASECDRSVPGECTGSYHDMFGLDGRRLSEEHACLQTEPRPGPSPGPGTCQWVQGRLPNNTVAVVVTTSTAEATDHVPATWDNSAGQ
ncbi:metalloproteinase inhibitor 4-like [Petromyzon marinus]|uniref:Metalloproteinase inhibitor 4-like n=2 Tax=Petromyzon marinus TaxID=7757 RepID=A0AAJ7U038_PETMA|nr:metalloproteinase inhibitor 4-like [Petromyzon marinus]